MLHPFWAGGRGGGARGGARATRRRGRPFPRGPVGVLPRGPRLHALDLPARPAPRRPPRAVDARHRRRRGGVRGGVRAGRGSGRPAGDTPLRRAAPGGARARARGARGVPLRLAPRPQPAPPGPRRGRRGRLAAAGRSPERLPRDPRLLPGRAVREIAAPGRRLRPRRLRALPRDLPRTGHRAGPAHPVHGAGPRRARAGRADPRGARRRVERPPRPPARGLSDDRLRAPLPLRAAPLGARRLRLPRRERARGGRARAPPLAVRPPVRLPRAAARGRGAPRPRQRPRLRRRLPALGAGAAPLDVRPADRLAAELREPPRDRAPPAGAGTLHAGARAAAAQPVPPPLRLRSRLGRRRDRPEAADRLHAAPAGPFPRPAGEARTPRRRDRRGPRRPRRRRDVAGRPARSGRNGLGPHPAAGEGGGRARGAAAGGRGRANRGRAPTLLAVLGLPRDRRFDGPVLEEARPRPPGGASLNAGSAGPR